MMLQAAASPDVLGCYLHMLHGLLAMLMGVCTS